MHANFADLTPDGCHFWMTLSPRTSEPVRHTPVLPPLEQNSGDATDEKSMVGKICGKINRSLRHLAHDRCEGASRGPLCKAPV